MLSCFKSLRIHRCTDLKLVEFKILRLLIGLGRVSEVTASNEKRYSLLRHIPTLSILSYHNENRVSS